MARARARAVTLPARPRGRRLAPVLPSGRSLLTGFGLLALAAALYGVARETSVFAVTELRVEGVGRGLERTIEQELGEVVGTSLVAVDTAALAARLAELPAVQSAAVDRAFPHRLVVSVVPERPAAVVRRGSESWLLSERGRVIRELRQGTHQRLPRLWLAKTVPFGAGDFLLAGDLRDVVQALAALGEEGLPSRVRTVRAKAGEVTLALVSGLELRLGAATDLRLKLAVARRILPLLNGSETYVDLSVAERPVAGTTLNSEVEVDP